MSSSKGKGKEVVTHSESRDITPPFGLIDTKPLFYSNRVDIVKSHGICTSFSDKGVLPKGYVQESKLHDAFARGINIHELEGRGRKQYLLWSLVDGSGTKALTELFSPFLNRDDRDFFYRNIQALIKAGANDVFVERTNGGPYEQYMSLICRGDDIRRGVSLFIAFFGRRAHSPCDCCLSRMGRNFSSTSDGSVPVMLPFFECRLIRGFRSNACANCLYHIEGKECSFIHANNIKEIMNALPGELKEGDEMLKSELVLGKYTKASTEYDFDKAREEGLGVVKGYRPGPRKTKPIEPQPWE